MKRKLFLNANAPAIIHSWAVDKGHYGMTWSLYIGWQTNAEFKR